MLTAKEGEKMKVEQVSIHDIKMYDNNAKKHSQSQLDKIAKSLEIFGWQQPIVLDKNNVIVAGHGRYLAAKQLGIERIPCKYADDLTEDEIKAFRILDNRIAESEIDINIELEEISNLDFNFDDFELDLFSIDDIDEVNGYDKNNDNREYFEKTFTFPVEKKREITNYLKKHIQEITDEIIRKACEK